MRSIEKEAYYWADHGIDTMEQAAVYMQNQLLRQSQLGKIKELLGIAGRRLTPGEENYILTVALAGASAKRRSAWPMKRPAWPRAGSNGRTATRSCAAGTSRASRRSAQIEAGDRAPAKPSAGKYSRGVQQHNDALSDLQIAAIDRMLNEKED